MEQRMGLFIPPQEAGGSLTSSKVQAIVGSPYSNIQELREFSEGYGGISEAILADFVDNPDNNYEIKRMLDNPNMPPFQKAVLFSQLRSERARELGLNTPEDPSVDYSVRLFSPKWDLCSWSEERLISSIRNSSVAAVGPGLLMKFEGRMTALCYSRFTTASGTFLEGNWYSPIDSNLREELVEAHDTGNPRPDCAEGAWLLIREKYPRYTNLVSHSRMVAERLPDKFVNNINGRDRKSFRRDNEESYDGNTDRLATF